FGSRVCRWTIRGFTIRVLSIVVVHCSRSVPQGKTLCSPVLTEYGWPVHRRRLVWLQDGLPGVPGLLNRLRPTLPADDYDWRIHETVSDGHRWPRPDFRNADSGVLSGFDPGDYSSLDVAEP